MNGSCRRHGTETAPAQAIQADHWSKRVVIEQFLAKCFQEGTELIVSKIQRAEFAIESGKATSGSIEVDGTTMGFVAAKPLWIDKRSNR